jgi:hypothetical protein
MSKNPYTGPSEQSVPRDATAKVQINRANFAKARAMWIDQVADDERLGATDFRVAYEIARHLSGDSFDCYPSQALLAQKCNLSPRTVWTSLQNLERFAHLRRRGGGRSGILRPLLAEGTLNRLLRASTERERRSREREANRGLI